MPADDVPMSAPEIDSGALAGPEAALRGQVSAIGLGVTALLSQGLLPALLGGLAGAHRIGDADIGLATSLEALAITGMSALAAVLFQPRGLRAVGAVAALLLGLTAALAVFASLPVQQVALRAAAGLAEGVLFWIAMEGVAHAALAERAAGLLMAAVTAATLLATAVVTQLVLPRFGPDGGLLVLAAASACGVPFALLLPRQRRARSAESSALPGAAGWIVLAAALLFNAAGMDFLVYIVPLGARAGVGELAAGQALTALIAAQLAGAMAAAGLSGRVDARVMIWACAIGYVLVWPLYLVSSGAGLFIALSAAHGFITFLALPFLYPVTIAADPTRKAAVLIGPAQMLGTALGPLLGAGVVQGGNVSGLIPLGLVLLGLAMAPITAISWLRRERFGIPSRAAQS